MFSKASKSQIEYLQAAVRLQEDMLNGCNSFLKNQLDALQKYRETGMVVNKDQMKPSIQAANNFMSCTWIGYRSHTILQLPDEVLSRDDGFDQ